nr:transposase [Ferrimicrobium acidiphilum]
MMRRVFRFRLYPSLEQEKRMFHIVETCRRLWNDALSHRKNRWEMERVSTSYSMQQWILTGERKRDPELRELYSQVAQDVLHRLDDAFQSFFDHISKRPRFKAFSQCGSFTYPQAYNGSVFLDGGQVHLSRVGDVTIVVHRQIPVDGKLKVCTVRREACGEWYAVLVYETDEPEPVQKEIFESPIGIDVGLKSIIATSDGQKIRPPEFLRKAERRLKRLQKRLSRKQKGSRNREKARHLVAVQHAKVARQRSNFNHVLSARVVRAHDLVIMEDLRIKNMVKNYHLAKSIHDAAWHQLRTFIEYKEKRRGGLMHPVEPAYGSQDCNACGARNHILLSQRVFKCDECSHEQDRDVNAAANYLQRGLRELGQDMPEFTPVEIRPPLLVATPRASRVEEAGTVRGGCTFPEAHRL